jgi:hypothetical protein
MAAINLGKYPLPTAKDRASALTETVAREMVA